MKLRDKKDFDYLLSLADCNENELSNENFEKFLNGELHLELLEETNEEKKRKKQKLIDAFSLIRYIVEDAAILQARNINNTNSQFSLEYKKVLPKTDHYLSRRITHSFDSKRTQIVLNRLQTKLALEGLPEGNTIDLSTNGHSISVTKICNDKNDVNNKKYHYIVVDSNGLRPVLCKSSETKSAEDELCNVIEIISNRHLHIQQDQYKPRITYRNTTKINKEVRKCFAKKDKDGRPYYESESLEFSLFKYKIAQELIFAVQEGNSEDVKNLLKRGAYINCVNEYGCTPLIVASQYGNIEIVKFLLYNKANVEVKDNSNQTPLHFASYYGHSEVIISLLDNGANINATNNEGKTALHFASAYGCINCVSVLLGKGGNIDDKDNHLRTPLYYAAGNDKIEMVEYLLENNANINKDCYGETALDLARENCNRRMVTLLEKAAQPKSDVSKTVTESFQQLSM